MVDEVYIVYVVLLWDFLCSRPNIIYFASVCWSGIDNISCTKEIHWWSLQLRL